MRRRIFGIAFSPLGATEIADLITRPERPSEFRMLVTANLDHVAQLTVNAAFRAAYDHAWIATIDGTPVYLYGLLRGSGVTGRVTGSDLVPLLLARLIPNVHRPFLVAASAATAEAITAQLMGRGFAREAIASAVPDLGFEADRHRSDLLVKSVKEHGTTHLLMGVGAPKSEIWMHTYRQSLSGCFGFGFGAGLDYAAGTRIRAPRALRVLGMEWAWRVASEPRRLFRRYFINSWGFLRAIAADLRQTGAKQSQ